MIKIVLADDHEVVRHGLRLLLEAESDLNVVGEASDGLETIKLVEKVKPDILVLDLMMEGLNGIEVTRQVTKYAPTTRVIILSMYGNEGYVLEALRAGAKAYVLKKSSAANLVTAIREVTTGHRYLSPPISEMAIESYLQKSQPTVMDPYDTLTARERETFYLAAHGHTSAEIAARLCISHRTVEVHRANMMKKLNLRTQVDLIRYALQRGILPAEE